MLFVLKEIEEEAFNSHKIDLDFFDNNYYKSNVYQSMRDGLVAFMEFIEKQKTIYHNEEILLVSNLWFFFYVGVQFLFYFKHHSKVAFVWQHAPCIKQNKRE